MPPAVPQARNWGHWATGLVALSSGHRCTDLPELEMELPGRLGVHTLSPAPGLELSSPRTLSPHLNPLLTFLAERAGNSGSLQPGFLLAGFHLIYRISQNLRPHNFKIHHYFCATKFLKMLPIKL